MASKKLTAEELFLEVWNDYGFTGSDITREHKFHPTRRWRFDFAFPSRRVGIEIDGRGRHQTVVGVRNDCEKANAAVELGWVILRIPTSDIKQRPTLIDFIDLVCRVLCERENYDERELDKKVEKLPKVPSPSKCQASRSA